MTKTPFTWNSDNCERRSQRCSQLMLGLMGIALMGMMMNLASFYLLVPGALMIFAIRLAQQHYDQLLAQFDEAEIILSPKTFLIKQPATGSEQRIRYKDLNQIETFKRWGISGIRLHLDQQESIALAGFDEALEAALKAAWQKEM